MGKMTTADKIQYVNAFQPLSERHPDPTVEIWSDIEGYRYRISNFGRIHNLKTGKVWHGSPRGNGYRSIQLHDDSLPAKNAYIHRLVAHAFLGPCPGGHEVNHRDGDRCNNRVENLEYVTSSRNTEHSIECGGFPVGSRRYNAKLDEHKVRMIRASGRHPSLLAAELGVTEPTIYKARDRQSWRHVYP